MSEHPIIFSGPMVRAILAGRKTQTRRLIRFPLNCPFGRVGDTLWVRETWCAADEMLDGFAREDPVCIGYQADKSAIMHEAANVHRVDTHQWNWQHDCIKWRSPIYMPRWASRIGLAVTDVSVERLQEISDQDARAEGIDVDEFADARLKFSRLWDSINAKRGPWAQNPYVWVITFERLGDRNE